jgi:aromatic-L-amino-acid/L-tryptophan decarboxylase
MVNIDEFRQNAHELVDWIADYFTNVDKFPVRSQLNYGEIKKSMPQEAPIISEPIESIFRDFREIILPGITHWQSPKFFAYFPSNNSLPSVLAEFIMAAMGVQGMKWITSPAATELEEVVTVWIRKMINLPSDFSGVILDTASVATLCAIIAAREKVTRLDSNKNGMESKKLRIYCSEEAHSSIEKAVRIAGLGSKNLKKIEVDSTCKMIPEKLKSIIEEDIREGYVPACIVAAFGTTGTCALDPVEEIGKIAKEYNIWLHVDGAFAGTALILPEFRKTVKGLELADSFVFNPHKWMFTNFDCSLFYVKDKEHLQDTFRLVPSYLQTQTNTEANDYSNWGIHLGRRFRALKLWFVIRNYGIKGLQDRIREHILFSEYFEEQILKFGNFELVVPRNLTVISFRFRPLTVNDENEINRLNAALLEKINASGKIYISHTTIRGKFTLRFVCAQTNVQQEHVDEAINTITMFAKELI